MNKDIKESEKKAIDLSALSAELLLWPGNQYCVVENRFEDEDINPSTFSGMCNGFLNDYELNEIKEALSDCDESLSPIDPSDPLYLSARVQVIDKGLGGKVSILFIDCGVFNDGIYELTASGFEKKKPIVPHITSRKNGKRISRENEAEVINLFNAVGGILKYRMNRVAKVDFRII